MSGNTLLPPALIVATLNAAATPKAAVSSLLSVYYRRGYQLVAITAQANGNAIQVSVFEGMLTDLKAPDALTCYFNSLEYRENIRNSEIIRDQLDADAYASRSGNQLSANLSPASNPGGSVLTITQSRTPNYFPVSGAVNFGNYGSRYSSGYVAGGYVSANLTHGIQITANLTQGLPGLRAESYGSNYYQNGVGASIVTPYGTYGASASWTHFHLGQATYPLYPDGNIFTYQVTGTQLLYADDATRVLLNEAFNRVKYRETALNDHYTLADQQYNYLSLGGNINHSLTIGALPGSLTAGITFNVGISSPTGSLVDTPGVATSHFKYTDLTFSYQQVLPYAFHGNFTGQAQISASTLPSQQQWVLGGLGSLSAWEPGTIEGDSGYVAHLEVDAPPLIRHKSSVTLGAFLEAGESTFRTPSADTAPWQLLSDAGLSLQLQLPYQLSATAMTAIPIATSGFTAATHSDLKLNRINAFFVVQKGF